MQNSRRLMKKNKMRQKNDLVSLKIEGGGIK